MNIVTKVLAVLVALEFLYIFYLETIATASSKTSKVFGMTTEELSNKNVNVLFKNQGVYNGLLSVLILLSVFAFASRTALIGRPCDSDPDLVHLLRGQTVLLLNLS